MGVVDIRQAFNSAAQGKLICQRALMVCCDSESRQGGAQRDHQLLMLQLSDGSKHEILVKPGESLNNAAAAHARKLING